MASKIMWAGVAAFCASYCTVLSGCNSGNGATAVSSAELLGKWMFTKSEIHTQFTVTNNGVVAADERTDTTMDVTGMGFYLELKDSSKYVANFPGSPGDFSEKTSAAGVIESGTWSVTGNTLALVNTGFYIDTVLATVSISGTTGVFTLNSTEEYTEGTFKTVDTQSSINTATKQ